MKTLNKIVMIKTRTLNIGNDPDSPEYINNMISKLETAKEMYEQNGNHEWRFRTDEKLQWYKSKKKSIQKKQKKRVKYAKCDSEMVEVIRSNQHLPVSEIALITGLSKSTINKKIKHIH